MKLQVWLYDIEEEKEMRGGFYLWPLQGKQWQLFLSSSVGTVKILCRTFGHLPFPVFVKAVPHSRGISKAGDYSGSSSLISQV
jgi:hypothetical protein